MKEETLMMKRENITTETIRKIEKIEKIRTEEIKIETHNQVIVKIETVKIVLLIKGNQMTERKNHKKK
jgi:hypothetical protein